ncbi:NmrA-like family protein [Aspergillus novofumigatus IBT 16806]|uniref:NmrA-like family protein n=1 Tax=Aspergillus novofumigatus (strain IBT 16806) TaxID=1392255 RepID=A0A2I1BXQ8_ASPN1|nr:NmrA-like family protein [Aspergillus novofumigatus IBT 16806]PKX90149.1 NmrA-like family protein [Aspergillus novofumigatus IBT 16806]
MSQPTVIVFGPTGGVGSATALTAHKHNAKVILAMRDTTKSIPGLTSEQESTGNFERVQADLTSPESIHAAVTKTGAKHAFIYLTFGTADAMRASIEALKGAGIETVVFLSSISVSIHGDADAVPPSDFIAFSHAQVEVNLRDVFGDDYVAVRPAFFASNSLWWKSGALGGEVKLAYPEAVYDYIAPEDIGSVAGTFLVNGLPAGEDGSKKNSVELVGPEKMTIREVVGVIGKAVGKEVKVTQVDEQEALQDMITVTGLPEPVANAILAQLRKQEESDGFFGLPEEALGNVQRYTGRPSLRFHEWVDLNKEKFLA